MKYKVTLAATALLIIVSPAFYVIFHDSQQGLKIYPDGLYVGLTADGNVTNTKVLIDKVKSFTNFIIINNPDVIRDRASVDEVCNYAKSSGLNFFVHHKHPLFGNIIMILLIGLRKLKANMVIAFWEFICLMNQVEINLIKETLGNLMNSQCLRLI